VHLSTKAIPMSLNSMGVPVGKCRFWSLSLCRKPPVLGSTGIPSCLSRVVDFIPDEDLSTCSNGCSNKQAQISEAHEVPVSPLTQGQHGSVPRVFHSLMRLPHGTGTSKARLELVLHQKTSQLRECLNVLLVPWPTMSCGHVPWPRWWRWLLCQEGHGLSAMGQKGRSQQSAHSQKPANLQAPRNMGG
jgi:hypothetical protein